MKDNFVHLHSHADTSILDGYSTISELIKEVERIGQPAIAITDHGNMHGIYELFKHAKEAGIKPIAGVEAYMTPSIVNRLYRGPAYLGDGGRDDVSGRGAYTHITLLAENNEGLKNLYKMQMQSWTEGFYQKNRIDFELLELYGKGIIATTGCPSGEVQTRLRLGQEKEALEYAAKLQDILGKDNVYMELMEHGMTSELERGVRKQLLEIAKKLGMPLVATNDLHYARHSDAKGHEELLCVQTRSVMSNPPEYTGQGSRFAFEGNEYYVKTRAEMEKYFSDLPEALNNTLAIAERCEITIEPDETLRPTIQPPSGKTEIEYLKTQAFEGLARRLPSKKDDPIYIDRLNTELGVIEMKNYIGYFLVVSDFVRWGKFTANPPVPTGFGRGCLSADTNVLTPLGFKKIKDIQVGDTVFDELGNQVVVPQVFEYDCNEPLVEIVGYYGNKGNKMTSDHKVLVSKANLETVKSRASSGIRYSKEINHPIWVRADEVEVGDLVVMPKLNFADEIKGFAVHPISTVSQNRKLKHSIRNIASSTGVSRSTVMDFVSSGGQVRGAASLKINNYLIDNNLTVKDLVEQQTVTTLLKKDFIEANYDMGFVLGLFISDGWIRQDNKTSIGFAQRKSEDEGIIPSALERVFGLKAHIADAKEKDLRQYTIRHKGVRALFANLFKNYNFNAYSKYIPSELLNTNEEFRRGLLQGLWYGDGTHKGKSKYTTVSQNLAEGVYTLLLSLGLPASFGEYKRIEKRDEYNKNGRDSWTEYSVVTAHNFETKNMTRGRGFDGRFNYYRVREINSVAPEGKVYDFTVPTTNSYVTDSYVVHNSAAGSLLGYCLDITDVDPIKYDLLFERFINPERDSPPDIDMDFNDTDRERVIEYVKGKYGLDKVAQIVTFGKIGAKAAIKDAVRILEQPFNVGEQLSKALPEPVAGHPITLSEVYDPSAERYQEAGEFRELVKKLQAEQVLDVAKAFEGRTRSTGVHAAALVVSKKPVVETVPMMQRQADGAMITQWDYPTCEGLGLLKVDFLGLRNLGIIANAIKNVEKTKGIQIDIQDIIQGDMDDLKTYELLTRGDSLGVFQLDSQGLRSLMKLLRPNNFNDISALIALYRPGPMGVNAHTDYALRKNGEQEVIPIHPELKEALEEILGSTFQIIVYQEQIMRIAQKVADYSLAQADNLRRAMGKKKKSVLDAEYIPFSEGMKKNGYSDEAIKTLWEILIPFADYGFNKSHSVGYGVLSYLTAYLKANYPAEFMSALLSSVADDTDKTALYLDDCRSMGIRVLPPDLNSSMSDYATINDKHIRFGFKAIRGLGEKVAEEIIEIRGDRPFTSVQDFVNRVPKTLANKRILEALTLGGAFDSLGVPRKSMIEFIPEITALISKANKKPTKAQQAKLDAAKEQAALFSEEIIEVKPIIEFEVPDNGEYSKLEKLKLERHALGLYVSGHPLEGLDLTAANATKIIDFIDEVIKPIEGWIPRDAKPMKIGGIVTSLSKKRTKKGETFAIGTIEDLTGSIPFVMFPKAFAEHGSFLELDGVYQMQGFPRKRDMDGLNFTVDAIRPLEFSDSGKLSLRIKLTEKQFESGKTALLERLAKHEASGAGSTNVIVSIKDEESNVREEILPINVKANPALTQEIRELFGMLSIGRWRKI